MIRNTQAVTLYRNRQTKLEAKVEIGEYEGRTGLFVASNGGGKNNPDHDDAIELILKIFREMAIESIHVFRAPHKRIKKYKTPNIQDKLINVKKTDITNPLAMGPCIITTSSEELIDKQLLIKLFSDIFLDEENINIEKMQEHTSNHEYNSFVKKYKIVKTNKNIQKIPFWERLLYRIFRSIGLKIRLGQQKFRSNLLEVYEGKCIITGTSIEEILEASHIVPYSKKGNFDIENGLLLRPDIHALFDKKLIKIELSDNILIVNFDKIINDRNYQILFENIEQININVPENFDLDKLSNNLKKSLKIKF